MSKEALKLALEAFSVIAIADNLDWIRHKAEQQATAIKQALAQPVQEPVAWVLLREDEDGFEPIQFYGGKEKPETAAGELKPRFTLRPVCFADTTPPSAQPAPVQEPSGFFRHEDACGDEVGPPTPYYLTPPAAQRQWVGLTDEQRNDCIKFPQRNLLARDGTTSQRIARAIEVKLKEKNT